MAGLVSSHTARRAVVLVVLLASALVLAGCDAGEEAGASEGTPTPAPPPAVASPATLDAYRYTVSMEISGADIGEEQAPPGINLKETPFTVAIEGEVANPDGHRSTVEASIGSIPPLTLERVQVGAQVWMRQAGGEWRAAAGGAGADGTDGDLLGGNIDVNPNTLFGRDEVAFASFAEQLQGLPFTREQVNGVDAVRYDFDAEASRRVFAGVPGLESLGGQAVEPQVSLWLAQASGVPVRLSAVVHDELGEPAFQMELNLLDLNDPAIAVVAPQ